MKSKSDQFTSEMFGNRPGRPPKLNALTPAQRARRYRAKKVISVTRHGNSCDCCGSVDGNHTGICGAGQLGHK